MQIIIKKEKQQKANWLFVWEKKNVNIVDIPLVVSLKSQKIQYGYENSKFSPQLLSLPLHNENCSYAVYSQMPFSTMYLAFWLAHVFFHIFRIDWNLLHYMILLCVLSESTKTFIYPTPCFKSVVAFSPLWSSAYSFRMCILITKIMAHTYIVFFSQYPKRVTETIIHSYTFTLVVVSYVCSHSFPGADWQACLPVCFSTIVCQ